MTRRPDRDPIDDDPVDHELETNELVESAGLHNTVAVAGPGALLMVPLARLLTKAKEILRRP